MKVFMIGGTGLLGSAAAELFIEKGHTVSSMALPPLPPGAQLPEKMELHMGNYLEATDDELREMLRGSDCFVFAAGVDERVEFPAPVYAAYEKYNIDPVRRLLALAKEEGVKSSVVLGSYFSYFAKEHRDMELCKKHPYIRSRLQQEKAALEFADGEMNVAVLELPYIFGTQPGRKPVWTILIEQLEGMGPVTMYPQGGTTMLTVRQVAQAIVGAAEKNRGGRAYPIGFYNLTWDEFLKIVHRAMGKPDRKIIHIPKWAFRLYGEHMMKAYAQRNVEAGINAVDLAEIMCMNTFIDKKWSLELGVTEDYIESAIFDSVHLSVEAFRGNSELIGMKGE